ncbi:MAG TPA: helix-turn-helix domain-containing protein [Verrucomicrobiae bacterium]|jgi:hypothetical protein
MNASKPNDKTVTAPMESPARGNASAGAEEIMDRSCEGGASSLGIQFQSANITTVEAGHTGVEYEAGPRFESSFGGSTRAGSVYPDRLPSADMTVTATDVLTATAGELESAQPAGRGASEGAAATDFKRNLAISDADIRTATLRRSAIETYRALVSAGAGTRDAARKVGYPFHTIYNWCQAFDANGFDGLLPKSKMAGRKPKHKFTAQQAADVRALTLQTNRNATAGSVPEATRIAIKRGLLDYGTAQLIQSRFDAGQHPLPPYMRGQVRVTESEILAYRSPRNAWLNMVQSPGSLMLTVDDATGEEREIEPCERGTMDDGTINMVCCVPFNLPGNKCAENFGVMVGRFQFILPVDHRCYFIPGFNYTARPRSSYRAEDLTATLHTIFIEHGYWREMVLEHGVSASNLVTDTLGALNIKIIRASSPHQKVVESVFNRLWTKLSAMPGQVGRFMGEEEEINALIMSCRRGATDPRRHFPMLADVLKALREAITEHNSQLVKSRQYGQWIPRQLWDRYKIQNLRKLEQEQSWIFSPVITDPLTVRGFKVRKTVCLMEGYSEVFDFSADWMHSLQGALVKLYFNPFAPDCIATVVLAQDFQGRKAGVILGHAEQINRMTRFRRRAFGYGTDLDIGLDATRRNAQALRRSVVAIRSDGSTGAQVHEARNGVGDGQVVTNLPAMPRPELTSDRQRQKAAGVDEDEFSRQAAKLAREETRAQRRKPIISEDE